MADTLSKSALIGRIGGGLAGLSVTQISNIVHTICGLPAAYGYPVAEPVQEAWINFFYLLFGYYIMVTSWSSKAKQVLKGGE